MKTNPTLTDDALEAMLVRRMTRARPLGLEEVIMNDVATTEQRRRGPFGWHWPGRSSSLAFAGVLVVAGLLTALVVGGSLAGGDRATNQTNHGLTDTNAASPTAGIRMLTCDSRSLPGASATVDLTGSWEAAGSLVYLTEAGTTLWGVAIFDQLGPYLDPVVTDVGPYLVLHGTVEPNGKVHVDWASAGDRFSGEHRFDHFQDATGSIEFDIGVGNDGNTQLVAASEAGADWSGNGFSALVLTPCTPALH
jgi:hypothetical protein